MAETAVVEKAAPIIETKTAEVKPDAAKATTEKTSVVENKTAPVTEKKVEGKVETPAAELKTLLDEAGTEEVKLDADGKPIVEKEATVVPEKYEFKLPEGMTLDEASMAIVSPIFKELGLDNASAQKLVDLQSQLTKQGEEAHVAKFNQYVEDLKTEAKTFFGPKLPEVMRNVARARDQFIHKELQEKLNVSGLANDKDILVMLDKLGRTVGEGKFIQGKQSAPAKGDGSVKVEGVSLTDVYPSMSKK